MNKKVVVVLIVSLFLGAGIFWLQRPIVHSEHIVDFDYDCDADQVKEMFNDNIYWMLGSELKGRYSIDWVLKHRSSSQVKKLDNVVIKVWRENDEVVGFIAYYHYALLHWQILFLLVDKKHRRKGYAKKLMRYALDDMQNDYYKAQEIAVVTHLIILRGSYMNPLISNYNLQEGHIVIIFGSEISLEH